MGKFNITEDEKRNILKMYKSLISEQTQVAGGGLTHGGGADKEYCSNLESKLQKQLQDVASKGINIKNFRISEQPDHAKSRFGSITFHQQGKHTTVYSLVCQSKNGEKINPYFQSSTDNYQTIHNGALAQYKNLYPKMCERINTCVGFGTQPVG
jgi:hypothetical protein